MSWTKFMIKIILGRASLIVKQIKDGASAFKVTALLRYAIMTCCFAINAPAEARGKQYSGQPLWQAYIIAYTYAVTGSIFSASGRPLCSDLNSTELSLRTIANMRNSGQLHLGRNLISEHRAICAPSASHFLGASILITCYDCHSTAIRLRQWITGLKLVRFPTSMCDVVQINNTEIDVSKFPGSCIDYRFNNSNLEISINEKATILKLKMERDDGR